MTHLFAGMTGRTVGGYEFEVFGRYGEPSDLVGVIDGAGSGGEE